MTWAAEAAAIFLKEIRTEWRTRVAFSSVALFAVSALTLIAISMRGGEAASPETGAALIWIVLFFTASAGMARNFVQEEERGTALALRLSARSETVWTGKFAANALSLLLLTLLVAPLLLAMLALQAANAALLWCVLVLGTVGLAAVFTLVAALVAKASTRSGLLAALAFPVLTPLLLAAVHGTKAALGVGNPDGRFAAGAGDLQVLVSYAVIAVTASLLLFDSVWND